MGDKPLKIKSRVSFLVVIVLLFGLTIAMFDDVLFTSQARFLSRAGTDLFTKLLNLSDCRG